MVFPAVVKLLPVVDEPGLSGQEAGTKAKFREHRRELTENIYVSQVVRYSALLGGIGYGIFRLRLLQSRQDKQVAKEKAQAAKHAEAALGPIPASAKATH